jgi:hypothetical protein
MSLFRISGLKPLEPFYDEGSGSSRRSGKISSRETEIQKGRGGGIC